MEKYIHIKGARLHNLKNIELKIPRNSFTVITGPSGSGKSSLAFDTLYAEGQRRFVESLSSYARQFLEKMPKPEVDLISGIAPAIAIQQKTPSGNPRSTVGTVTEIYDYLRLLFARIGKTYCHNCGNLIQKDSIDTVLQYLESLPGGKACYITFPIHSAFHRMKHITREFMLAQGFVRIRQENRLIDLRKEEIDFSHPETYGVVDRLRTGDISDRNRLTESLETAFLYGEGFLAIAIEEEEVRHFNQQFLCSVCGTPAVEPEPRLFSFNNPYGACPGCQGFGDMVDIDINKVIPDDTRTLRQGAIAPWSTPSYKHLVTRMADAAARFGIPMNVPFRELSEEQRNIIMNGKGSFKGVRGFFSKLESKKYKVQVRVFISRYRSYFTCTMCHGARLRPEALAVRIGEKNISGLSMMPISGLKTFFRDLSLTSYEQGVAGQILQELHSRLDYLESVGLEYLHLNRRANTLSGGEYQRINLASALGSALTGTLYILDEPTIGLHPRDTGRLLNILTTLSGIGNTVVVVEHEKAVMEKADVIVDMGPASGEKGGEVVFSGSYHDLIEKSRGLTAAWLRHEKRLPEHTPRGGSKRFHLLIQGARENNLKNLDVRIPLDKMVCVTGVSGSGKSTLVESVLYNGYLSRKTHFNGKVGQHDNIRGLGYLKGMEMVDQSPIGRTPRSNPVTYIKAFDEIRKIFADRPQSRMHGYTPGHFSFNVAGGRCEVCQGDGQIKIEMQFLADIYIECDACHGKRYKEEILQVQYHGKNIHDVLQLTVDEAIDFFEGHSVLLRKLKTLQDVGLSYLKLGQPAPTLSGGEAQRIKLAAHLSKKTHEEVMFIFDEPTTGLHFDDISKLLQSFDALIARGASVLIIEHNLDVIRFADWIIDLGPEGGEQGGEIVAEGTPQDVAETAGSYTGQYLRTVLPETARLEEDNDNTV